jgi:hypothetical protein
MAAAAESGEGRRGGVRGWCMPSGYWAKSDEWAEVFIAHSAARRHAEFFSHHFMFLLLCAHPFFPTCTFFKKIHYKHIYSYKYDHLTL